MQSMTAVHTVGTLWQKLVLHLVEHRFRQNLTDKIKKPGRNFSLVFFLAYHSSFPDFVKILFDSRGSVPEVSL